MHTDDFLLVEVVGTGYHAGAGKNDRTSFISVDIVRENDGLRATVIEATTCRDSQSKQKVLAMVWEKSFRPEKLDFVSK
ncbi:hypothetical protein L5515_017337 [Caenorhabditis briggsae]|uniref:Uncharacterized protein n=1 Tax=Caenorhabditis briggsae TaxID=6238 RepID=A0AAE9JR65_CAEBR|nr:hypothetical protein L5515_017337 [Caenorhabditis briggsae]